MLDEALERDQPPQMRPGLRDRHGPRTPGRKDEGGRGHREPDRWALLSDAAPLLNVKDVAKGPRIRQTRRVGHYALGIDWEDGHESIMPYSSLRAHCPCGDCARVRNDGRVPGEPGTQLESLDVFGDASAFFTWSDGHESAYLLPELRALCRCAYCAGEPERPITG